MALAKTEKLKGAELRWIGVFIQMMEILHQRAFNEVGIHKRIFAVDDKTGYAARYLPPSYAQEEIPERITPREDAYFVNVKQFMDQMRVTPQVYPLMLDVNRQRAIPKYLYVALMALHEARHCAQFRLRARPLSEPAILKRTSELISKKNQTTLAPFIKKWRRLTRILRVHHREGYPRKEHDAQLVEGIGLFLWEYERIHGIELLTSYFPRLVLLGTNKRP